MNVLRAFSFSTSSALDAIGPLFTTLIAATVLTACDPGTGEAQDVKSRVLFKVVATLDSPELTEVSGLEIAEGPHFVVHNDDGPPELHVLDLAGKVQSRIRIRGARNRDWEDLTWVPTERGRLLAVGDIGDNAGVRETVQVYFVELPDLSTPPGGETIEVEPRHKLELRYPDGPRDCEAMAYDAASGQILFMTKRDKPPRLYGVDAASALSEPELELEYLGVTAEFRPPTRADHFRLGTDAAWISQPTGMDINDEASLAAVISYRSLYYFERAPHQTWAEAFSQPPREFLGPPDRDEEAVAFDLDMNSVYITTEGASAPIYHSGLPPPRQ